MADTLLCRAPAAAARVPPSRRIDPGPRRPRASLVAAATASSSGRQALKGAKARDSDLLSWAQDQGARSLASLAIRESEATGVRGVYTKRALEPDSVVCEVPRRLAFEVTTAKSKCPVKGLDQRFWDECDWWGKLACLLLVEMQRGSPYVAALPEAIPTPLHWSPDQLDLLQYPPLARQVGEQRRAWEALHERYRAACDGKDAVAAPLDQFIHAAECVRSRTFSGPYEGSNWETRVRQYALVLALAVGYVAGGFGEAYQAFNGALAVFLTILFRDLQVQRNPRSIRYVLCPVLDMFNHRGDVESDPSYEYFRNTFTLTLSKKVEEGEEVCINYGRRGNDELMQYYGFVVEDNKHDSYTLCDFLEKATALVQSWGGEYGAGTDGSGLEGRLAMLETNQMANDKVVIRPKKRGLTDRTLQTLRILVSSDEELRGKTALLDFRGKVSDANEERAFRLMCLVCRKELEEWLPTTAEDDEKALANLFRMTRDLSQAEVKAQALRFRIAKKRVIEKFLLANED